MFVRVDFRRCSWMFIVIGLVGFERLERIIGKGVLEMDVDFGRV